MSPYLYFTLFAGLLVQSHVFNVTQATTEMPSESTEKSKGVLNVTQSTTEMKSDPPEKRKDVSSVNQQTAQEMSESLEKGKDVPDATQSSTRKKLRFPFADWIGHFYITGPKLFMDVLLRTEYECSTLCSMEYCRYVNFHPLTYHCRIHHTAKLSAKLAMMNDSNWKLWEMSYPSNDDQPTIQMPRKDLVGSHLAATSRMMVLGPAS